jgi:hypothetical protein
MVIFFPPFPLVYMLYTLMALSRVMCSLSLPQFYWFGPCLALWRGLVTGAVICIIFTVYKRRYGHKFNRKCSGSTSSFGPIQSLRKPALITPQIGPPRLPNQVNYPKCEQMCPEARAEQQQSWLGCVSLFSHRIPPYTVYRIKDWENPGTDLGGLQTREPEKPYGVHRSPVWASSEARKR